MAIATITPHELNTAFTWVDHPGPWRGLTADQARQFDEDGFTVIPGAFPTDVIGEVRDAIDEQEAQLEAALRRSHDGNIFIYRADEITFTTHIVARSQVVRDF